MVTQDGGRFDLHQSVGENLTQWQEGIRLDGPGIYETGKAYAYPSIIGAGVNDKLTRQYNIFYYSRDDSSDHEWVNGNHYMVRRSLTFHQ